MTKWMDLILFILLLKQIQSLDIDKNRTCGIKGKIILIINAHLYKQFISLNVILETWAFFLVTLKDLI